MGSKIYLRRTCRKAPTESKQSSPTGLAARPRWGYFLLMTKSSTDNDDPTMSLAPKKLPRAYAYFDGQNLYNAAKRCFGETKVRYDPRVLAKLICDRKGWDLAKVYFYTGVPPANVSMYLNLFWSQKILNMKRQGVECHTRNLVYRRKEVTLDSGREETVAVAEEKGIDVQIAVDIVKHAYEGLYDVCLIFSQDNDLVPAVEHVKEIAKKQGRAVHFACAYPVGKDTERIGIRNTNWVEIDQEQYENCIDKRDYDPSIQKAIEATKRRR
jgi:uncharacterized LabA/DUF88 family protein